MKRQRGRNRGGGGGGKPQQNANRAFDSNGPEGVKVRGNAQHVFEKYQQLARDAASSGDRVLAENHLQHAEHYFRLLRAMQPQRPAAEILGRDQFASGFDIDFEDEAIQAQAEAADEAAAEAAQNSQNTQPRDENAQQDGGDGRDQRWQARDRDDQGGGGRRDRRDRWRERDDRGDRNRGDDRQARGDRDDQAGGGRRERDEQGGGRRDRDDQGGARRDKDPLPVVEPQGSGLGEERNSPVLRDSEGGESQAPAFLQASTAPRAETSEDDGGGRPRRRRRAPRSFEAGEGGAANEAEEA